MLYFDLTGPLVFDMIGRCKSQGLINENQGEGEKNLGSNDRKWGEARCKGEHIGGGYWGMWNEWGRGLGEMSWNARLHCELHCSKWIDNYIFWGGVAGGNRAQHTHPFACNQKTACRIAQACNRLPASSFWLVIDVQDRLGLICLRNRWTVIHLWLIQSSNANGFCATKSPAWLQKLLKEAFFL